jgi:hypothetical protein
MRLSRSGIGLSLLFHALAIGGAMRVAWRTPQPSMPPVLQGTIVWLAAPPPPPPTAEPTATAEAAIPDAVDRARAEGPTPRSGRAARADRRSEPAAAPAPALPATPPPATAPAPNLAEARRRATVDVIEGTARDDAHRSFAFPGTIGQQRAFDESERFRRRERGLQPPLTAFDSPAKGRTDLPEEPTGPFGVHWVADDRYVFHEPDDRFILPGLFVEPTTFTRRFARTDLFLTAKPYYLMSDEERKAVEAEKQRRERLRRPTTGVVMRAEKD